MDPNVRARLSELLRAARRLADANDALGREARARLPRSSGLSAENVEWALSHALETRPSEAELEQLVHSVESSARSHVLLSANVFVAAHRAIALALAASPVVFVRPSRREPDMTELLAEAAPGLFQRVEELTPAPGDQLFAFGRSETLDAVATRLPAGVAFHAHGPGFGVGVVSASFVHDAHAELHLARQLAIDISAFDQRGCLSPRLLLVEGARSRAIELARVIANALEARERVVPRGELAAFELAEVTRYRDTLSYSGELFAAGSGYVGVAAPDAPLELAPVGRNLHVLSVEDASALLRPAAHAITSFAHAGSPNERALLNAALPEARPAQFGAMQTPRFDGPVDRRVSARSARSLR